jgi:hypothetical protein
VLRLNRGIFKQADQETRFGETSRVYHRKLRDDAKRPRGSHGENAKVRKNLRHPSRNTVAEEASEVTLDPQLRATIDACAETFSDYYDDRRCDSATISVDHEGDWSIVVMQRANEI